MRQRQRYSLADLLLVWGFVLSFVGLLGAGCFEAYKVVSVIPAAFASSPANWRNPMSALLDDGQPNPFGRGRMTPRERAQNAERAAQQER